MLEEIINKPRFIEIINDFMRVSSSQNCRGYSLKASNKQGLLWDYNGTHEEIIAPKQDWDILNTCGVTKLVTSFSDNKMGQKELGASDWKDWFLSRALDCYVIPDTNFILNHYCSALLSPILGQSFKTLHFRLPRLVVLEIERQGNEKGEEKKRWAFYGAREVTFIRKAVDDFDNLPDCGDSLITSFPTQAGIGFTDMWIRREIHHALDFRMRPSRPILFLTSDLMNALAAEAEGLQTCYFCRIPQEKFFIADNINEHLFNLILATAIKYGEITLDLIIGGKVYLSYNLHGMWSGKTTSEWYSDSIKLKLIDETPK